MNKISANVILSLIFIQVLMTSNSSAQSNKNGRSTWSDLSTEIQYLSGTGKDDMVNWDFYCSEGMKSGKWTTIGVPSCWEQQGFGHYNYGHDDLDKRYKEHGLYKYQFAVFENWKSKDVKIVFEGVMTDAEVKINGKLAGEIHQGAFYEFKYTITDLLKYGVDNLLEVKVNKVSDNESINYAERKADFWIFGGIYRPVYLSVSPKENIDRLAVDAKADGAITADVFIDSKKADKIKLTLFDLKGNKIQDIKVEDIQKEEGKWSVSAQASNIRTWNPEQANLYNLQVSLLDKRGEVLHVVKQRIGFRTVEVLEGDGIYVNGQRIKFKGVNRHSFYPKSGRTCSKELSIEHVNMMKDMNMNAVRMSHYPPDVHFLDVCDSLGLFVIDEVCTWHSPHLDTEVGRKIVEEMVVRDVNHPSILLWANGNETGWNTELDDDYALWDIQKREVIHPWNIFRKTNTLHYFHYHALANDGYKKDKIFFPTEFLHGLYDGGHGAGLDDYWTQMWNMPLSAGGFLWDFADEGVVRTDKNNVLDFDGNHAADGIVGPYGEKEASYFTIKEVWSPIYIEDRFINDDFNGTFRIENRYHYTNLKDCKMTAKWVRFNGPEGSTDFDILSENRVDLAQLAPGGKAAFNVNMPSNWKSSDALHLTATDLYGKEIFTWSYPIQSPAQLNQDAVSDKGKGKVKSEIKNSQIIVEANNIVFTFSEKTGLLQEVKKGDKVIPLKNGPIILGQNDKIENVSVKTGNNMVEITAVFEKKDKTPEWTTHVELSSDIIKWTIYPNGLLDLSVEMKSEKRVTDYKGISFSFPEEEVAGMKWLGDGPYRVWRNRMKGTKFQVWENDYNNTVTGESGFVYPEFKGFFSSLYWAKIKSENNKGFTVFCHSPHTFLRMLTPENPSGDPKGRLSPKFPEGDISFVKNIPAIGTKFQQPDTMGPHGNSENYFGNADEPIVIKLTFEF
ncbi:glycoside hydrolase family 2 protein [Labilibaculum antarcticum]|uniref:beta-galactosidase n=1 Tax=Labilibaculum antarcticum TaxID=1717717 RepID=A0A1Y1CDQ2_9BACT|nr:glycoside hydrolase family 2 TIM barrel-domain containing protein [Labilibaculum antarcticum]BAX78476.1 beta-galactosidase [Labilibaculum antarcticum]